MWFLKRTPRINKTHYQKRLVIFYDILGWKSAIEEAGSDPEKIAELEGILLSYRRLLKTYNIAPNMYGDLRVSTFSDNVVVSYPDSSALLDVIRHVCFMQLHTVFNGFMIRGGMTFGDIVHTGGVVFGPALNRAYELESQVAKFPRIVVDKGMHAYTLNQFVYQDGEIEYLNPFQVQFFNYILNYNRRNVGDKPLNPHNFLYKCAFNLANRLDNMKPGKERDKVAWLYNLLAKDLQAPMFEGNEENLENQLTTWSVGYFRKVRGVYK